MGQERDHVPIAAQETFAVHNGVEVPYRLHLLVTSNSQFVFLMNAW